MHTFIELPTCPGSAPLARVEDAAALLGRLATSGLRQGVSVLAFAVQDRRVGLVVLGRRDRLRGWLARVRAGHALWARHRARALAWADPALIPLPDEDHATAYAHALHRLGEPDPLADPRSSLRDAAGLRCSAWFDPAWLRARGQPQRWLLGAGLSPTRAPLLEGSAPVPFVAWPLVEAAVEAATGQPGVDRRQAVLRTQAAARCGWTAEAIAALTGRGFAAVRRNLREPDRPELAATLAWLRDPALRARLPAHEAPISPGHARRARPHNAWRRSG